MAAPHRSDDAGTEATDRTMAAGRVLQVMLLALCLGALLNADALLERAERRDLDDPRRDASVFTWNLVADLSHLLSLDRPRQLLESVTGRDDDVEPFVLPPPPSGSPSPAPTTPGGAPDPSASVTTTTTVAGPELRTPTAAEPLRTWIGGDSMAQTMGISLSRAMLDVGLFETSLDYRISTGLTRPDYFDWPGHLAGIVAEQDPELLVIIFGANDSQGIEMPDGRVFERNSPDWLAEYRRRTAGTMDLLRDPDGDRLVVWVGQPPMRDGGFNERMAYLNNIYAEEAATRPWIRYFDTWPFFTDGAGAYAPSLASADGTIADMRTGDGIHLSTPGGDRLAWAIIEALRDDLDLSASTAAAPPSLAPPDEVRERTAVPAPGG